MSIFWDTLRKVQVLHPFHLFAYVILPEHFHWILQMPQDSPNFLKMMLAIKYNFTMNLKKELGIQGPVKVWQARFWDHVIRDEHDLQTHIDYIHWNPVKHGYVDDAGKWAESSFRFWSEKGFYGGEILNRKMDDILKMDFK